MAQIFFSESRAFHFLLLTNAEYADSVFNARVHKNILDFFLVLN